MPLGTVASLKDTNGVLPLLLVCVSFQGTSTKLLLSTHPLNAAEGGPSFPGVGVLPSGNYLGRLLQQDFEAIQQRSQLGIDRPARITLHIADADGYIWTNFAQQYGFRGASVQIALVMWQVGTSNFSSDAPLHFLGTCDMEIPRSGGMVLEVAANNSHNTATVKLPSFPIQGRCAHVFPSTTAEQTAALNDPSSPWYGCGYSAQVGGVGNGAFTSCEYLRSSCMARLGNAATTSVAPDGDLSHDQAGHYTARFSGIEWSPGTYYAIARNYTSGGKNPTFSFLNSQVLGQYQNLLYGTQWVTPKLANVIESGNDTKMEAMICTGDIGLWGVQQVVVNGVSINRAPSSDKNLWWNFNDGPSGGLASTGGRSGAMSRDSGYNDPAHRALGDPYGGIATIEIVVYKDIFTGFGVPTVQILASGPQLWVFSDQTTRALSGQFSPLNANPAWVLLDILTKANFSFAEMDMATFIAAAAFSDVAINYVGADGGTYSTRRYQCMFALEQRKTAGEIIAGVLRSFDAYMVQDKGTGLFQLFINQTLADSQSSAITGSNYNTGISSVHADGSAGTGYVAYLFDDSTIARKGSPPDELMDIEGEQNATAQTPNQIYIQFQDQNNGFVVDSLGDIDSFAVARAGGALQPGGSLIPETLNVIGIPSFDQAIRIASTYIAERQYGNEFADPRGTRVFTIGTTVRCEHLRVGHLVYFSSLKLGITHQLCRVIKIQPATNYEAARLTLQWHNDLWYTDLYGQQPASFLGNTGNFGPQRAPLPWQANAETPNSVIWPATEKTFELAQPLKADGSVLLTVGGCPPVNQVSPTIAAGGGSSGGTKPPIVGIQASIASSGGSIPGGTDWLLEVCAKDGNGYYTAPSHIVTAHVPAGSSANTITINGLMWAPGTASWEVFAGPDQFSITFQLAGSGTPSSITLTSLPNIAAYGAPDLAASTIFLQAKLVIHAGILGATVVSTSAGPNHVTISSAVGALTQNLAGYKLLMIGKSGLGDAEMPIVDFNIVSNSGYVLTVDRDPTALLFTGDIIVVCAQADIASATTIGCTLFANAFYPGGATAAVDVGQQVRIIAGKGRWQVRRITAVTSGTTYTVSPPWDDIPDATSIFIVEEVTWRFSAETADAATLPTVVNDAVASLNVTNLFGECLLIQALIGDPTGTAYSNEFRSPFRLITAKPVATQGAPGYVTLIIAFNSTTPDLALGRNFLLTLNQAAQVTISNPPGPIAAGTYISLYVLQDATGYRAPLAWGNTFGLDIQEQVLDGTPNTRSSYTITMHADGLWHLDSFLTGLPLN